MSDYNFEIIRLSVIEWCEKIKDKTEVTISKNIAETLVVDFDFQNCIAQLTVTNSHYTPFQYVYFEAMDINTSNIEETKPIYCFYDDETMRKEDVIEALDEALDFCSQYKVK